MILSDFFEKRVNVVCTDGDILTGYVGDYIDPIDNENGKPSIVIDTDSGALIELYEDDIKSIKVA